MPGPSNPDQIQANEEAVQAMVNLMGGITGMVDRGVRLMDLVPILQADPEDDLSGLRYLATRMTGGMGISAPMPTDETPIFPVEARDWLLRTGRVTEGNEGLIPQDKIDHLGLAALAIAQSEEMGLLSEAYKAATDNRSPLSRSIIIEVSGHIVEGYRGDA